MAHSVTAHHLRAGGAGRGRFTRTLRVYSASFLAVESPAVARSMETSDKCVLYSSLLYDLRDALERGEPLVFEVTNASLGRTTHVGVLEFSGTAHGVAYLPTWVCHNLMIEEGSECTFKLRSLPRIRFLRLALRQDAFLQVVRDPKQALEEALRTYTAVTVGDELVVHTGGAAFGFRVLEMKPVSASNACTLANADVELVFESGGEGGGDAALDDAQAVPSMRAAHVALSPGGVQSATLPAHGAVALYTVIAHAAPTGIAITVKCDAPAPPPPASASGTTTLTTLTPVLSSSRTPQLTSTAAGVSAEFLSLGPPAEEALPTPPASTPLTPDVDMFMSTTASTPSRWESTWSDVSHSMVKRIQLSGADAARAVNDTGAIVLYVAVVAHGGAVNFTITCEMGVFEHTVAHTGGDVLPGAVAPSTPVLVEEGSALCSNCGVAVPAAIMPMHVRTCARHTSRCTTCGVTYPRTTVHAHCDQCAYVAASRPDLDKHVEYTHSPAQCPAACGACVMPADMPAHSAVCPRRVCVCSWCGIHTPAHALEAHEDMCSSRSVACDGCGRLVARRRLATHVCGHPTPATPYVHTASGAVAPPPDMSLGPAAAAGGAAVARSRARVWVCGVCNHACADEDDAHVHIVTEHADDESSALARLRHVVVGGHEPEPTPASPVAVDRGGAFAALADEASSSSDDDEDADAGQSESAAAREHTEGGHTEYEVPDMSSWPVLGHFMSGAIPTHNVAWPALSSTVTHADDDEDEDAMLARALAQSMAEDDVLEVTAAAAAAVTAVAPMDAVGTASGSETVASVPVVEGGQVDAAAPLPPADLQPPPVVAADAPAAAHAALVSVPAMAEGAQPCACDACGQVCENLENLQLHMITECPHAEANAARMFA